MSRTPTATWETAWMLMARTLLRRAFDLGGVSQQALRQLIGTAQRGQVTAVHLVGHDPESLPHHAPLELGREEPVVSAQQEPRRHVGPRVERPRVGEHAVRLREHMV